MSIHSGKLAADLPMDRLSELLADEATQGLSTQESQELDALLAQHAGTDRDAMQRAAAALDVLMFCPSGDVERLPAMPESVRRKIAVPQAGLRLVGGDRGEDGALTGGSRNTRGSSAGASRGGSRGSWASLGWVAAAACAGLAALGWWSSISGTGGQSQSTVQTASLKTQLESLRASAKDLREVKWTRATDPTGANCDGSVVWSPSKQEGFMVFRGLKINDPLKEQYQLWIFDPGRDERYPVHGGVFDVSTENGETIVRIVPRLEVPRANTFVITVEKPGGVWVSDRSRIPVLAKIEG